LQIVERSTFPPSVSHSVLFNLETLLADGGNFGRAVFSNAEAEPARAAPTRAALTDSASHAKLQNKSGDVSFWRAR
jgi:hypothetical protein